MTEHKTLNTVIHAAFRRDIERFVRALETFPVGSRRRADQLVLAWDNFAHQLHLHHQDEETIFWPAFRAVGADESLVGDLDGEHQRMVRALEVAEAAMRTLGSDPSPANVEAARASVTDLRTVLLEHLAHEERDFEPFAAAHVEDPELKQAQKDVRKVHQGNAGMFVAWLRDSADADARAQLNRDMPPPVQFVLLHTSGRKYARTVSPAWS